MKISLNIMSEKSHLGSWLRELVCLFEPQLEVCHYSRNCSVLTPSWKNNHFQGEVNISKSLLHGNMINLCLNWFHTCEQVRVLFNLRVRLQCDVHLLSIISCVCFYIFLLIHVHSFNPFLITLMIAQFKFQFKILICSNINYVVIEAKYVSLFILINKC